MGCRKELLKRDNLAAQPPPLRGEVPIDCDLLHRHQRAARRRRPPRRTGAMAGCCCCSTRRSAWRSASGLEPFAAKFGISRRRPWSTRSGRCRRRLGGLRQRLPRPVSTMRGLVVVLPVARSVTTTAAGATASILLTTPTGGWGERDIAGPFRTPPDPATTPTPRDSRWGGRPRSRQDGGLGSSRSATRISWSTADRQRRQTQPRPQRGQLAGAGEEALGTRRASPSRCSWCCRSSR
jgi:hypothetical protein